MYTFLFIVEVHVYILILTLHPPNLPYLFNLIPLFSFINLNQ